MGVSASVILFAVIAFASTTADDLVVLVTFQSLNMQNKDQTTAEMMKNMWLIAMGQVLSYTIIVSLSLLGLVLGNFLPEDYVALIGFIPLFLGIKGIYDYFFDDDGEEEENKEENVSKLESGIGNKREGEEAGNVSLVTMSPLVEAVDGGSTATIAANSDHDREHSGEHSHSHIHRVLKRSNSTQAIEHHVVHDVSKHDAQEHRRRHSEHQDSTDDIESGIDTAGEVKVGETPIAVRRENGNDDEDDDDEEEESNILSRTFDKFFSAIGLHPMIQKVAIAGLIVGADNVAVYISLFAKLKDIDVVIVALIIFYTLLIFYIIMSYFLVIKIPNVSIYIDRYASIGIPVLLIVLGLFILSESILFELLTA